MSAPTVFCVTDFWFPKRGGTERSVENLCRTLPREFGVQVLTSRTTSDESECFPFRVHELPADERAGYYPAALDLISACSGPRIIHLTAFSFFWPEAQVDF